MFEGHAELVIQQRKEWTEVLTDWETRNQYAVRDAQGAEIGLVAERARGLWDVLRRGFLRSHRPLDVRVFDRAGAAVLALTRPFFWLFSRLDVSAPDGRPIGCVLRRFGVLHKRYDLEDAVGRRFARIAAPRWKLWTFPVVAESGDGEAVIAKRWGGAMREVFSDADTFRIAFGNTGWSPDQRAVILAAALSIDFDFFENNQGRSGGLLGLGR